MIERRKYSEIPRIESKLIMDEPLKILVIRPDRLGDVVLSTPVFEVIKRQYPKAKLTVLVKEHVVSILKGLSSVDQLMVFEPEGKHSGIKGFFRLYQEIRDQKFRLAVVLQSHWKIAAALFLAGIEYRIGPLSKPHSYLFFNRGVRQRRSHVEMHETDYNLQLLREIGVRVGTRQISTRVHISKDVQTSAKAWLSEKGWQQNKPLILVHPGMGGSALNWPESHYEELIKALIQNGHQVLVTGGPTEAELLSRMEKSLGQQKESAIFYLGTKTSSIDFMGALCKFASVVVAPSTGPLHLAVAVGKPVVTFYPPIRVQSAIRWGPYMPDETRASILVPEVYCGQDFKCLGHLCNYFPCMKGLTVKQAFDQIQHQISQLSQRESKGDPSQ